MILNNVCLYLYIYRNYCTYFYTLVVRHLYRRFQKLPWCQVLCGDSLSMSGVLWDKVCWYIYILYRCVDIKMAPVAFYASPRRDCESCSRPRTPCKQRDVLSHEAVFCRVRWSQCSPSTKSTDMICSLSQQRTQWRTEKILTSYIALYEILRSWNIIFCNPVL